MLTGLRASDGAVLMRLCGADQRLFLRLGNLMQAKLAVTEPALATIVGSQPLRKLLLDKRLRDADGAAFITLLSESGVGDSDLVLVAGEDVEPGWRVIALADELGNPLLSSASANLATPILSTVSAMLPSLSPALRAPVEGLLNASADDQRAAALEQLRYAAPPLAVVSELMPMLLADAAELVRERAISLLVASGAHTSVVDLIRILQRGDNAALLRAAENISHLPPGQLDLVAAALIAAVGRGQASQALVAVCERIADHLARHRGLERLIELLIPTRFSLVGLVRALQREDSARIDSQLARLLGQGAESDAQIVILLAAPGSRGDDVLVDRGIDLLLSPREEPQERMALAAALRRFDAAGEPLVATRIVARGVNAISASRDTTVHWLLSELCRDQRVDPATADSLAEGMRRLLREAPGPHLVSMLEQQLPALLPASEARRRQLVEPLGEIVARYRDPRTRELATACISAFGRAAIDPAWRLIEEHPQPAVRELAATVLPGLYVDEPAPALVEAVRRAVAAAKTVKTDAERAPLLTAAARIANLPALDADHAPARSVDAATPGLGEHAIDALGHLAAGRHLDPGRRAQVLEDLLATATAELPDAPIARTVDPSTDDTTFVLDELLGTHTEIMPRVLAALGTIGASSTLPPQLLRRLVDRLCDHWALVSTWRVVWGPANVQELARVLGQLAATPTFPGPLRLKVCEALLPRMSQLTVARSLAKVFVQADGSFLSALAGRAVTSLIEFAGGRTYADDEQDELCEALIDFLGIPHLGTNGDALRRRLVGLLAAHRARLGERAKRRLRTIAEGADAELKQRLDWV